MKKIFTKQNIVRFALFVGAVALIMLAMPRDDRRTYLYEKNQPWRYPLLTAQFDVPVMPDSATIKHLQDSIDKQFVPFVIESSEVAEKNVAEFRENISQQKVVDADWLVSMLETIYNRGIIDNAINEIVEAGNMDYVRTTHHDEPDNFISTLPTGSMLTSREAYLMIDSLYSSRNKDANLSITKINDYLQPNILSDVEADEKFKTQEYLNVTGAQGVIKQGQRIVDRGEIITPQIYKNLQVYEEMLSQHSSLSKHENFYLLGKGVYILIVLGLFFLFVKVYRKSMFDSIRQMTFLMTFITIFSVFTMLMAEHITSGLYMSPFAAVPVIILIFFDSRTAIFSLIATILLCAQVATNQFQFIFMELVVGLVATFSIQQLSRRSQLLRTAFYAFVCYSVCYIVTVMIENGSIDGINWRIFGVFGINTVVLSFAYVLIFIIEKVFGFTSTVTLVELSDINNPLLRRLAEEAPGTFQHSIQVSTLAADAARAIGANTQLVRTGALYHDIGKMESPIFFTENQHGVNPHNGLDPDVSARKIISHVAAGLNLAAKEKLPRVIRNFITEHHGKGVAKYFFTTACNESPDAKVDPANFMYPGPNPQTKETAIMMMADAVEAASRSLKEYNAESISGLVDKIVDGQMMDGLFKESPISFREIEIIKNTFKMRLGTIYHSRVEYPKLNNPQTQTT